MRTLPLALIVAIAAPAAAQPPGFRLETVVTGLDLASAFAFAPDGRLFVVERVTGKIRVVTNGQLGGTWATVPAVASAGSEEGLLGVAVHPSFPHNGQVFVHYTATGGDSPAVLERYTEAGGVGTQPTRLGPSIPAPGGHLGGPIVFGRDGALLVARGDGWVSPFAQALGSLHGKILRLAADGSVPSDNPFFGVAGAESAIWSYGHRNVFGLCVHPTSGRVYATENGAFRGDELNLIVAGGNYGWPIYEGTEPAPDPATVDPLLVRAPEPSYTGAAFSGGALYPARYRGGWFVGDFNVGDLTLVDLDASGDRVVASSLFHRFAGPVIDVADGPDGNIYVLHSDTPSMRGADRVTRIVHDNAPFPSLRVSAVANRAIGGSLTAGVVASPSARVLVWLSFTRFPTPVPTPWGDVWLPADLLLPEFTVAADGRGHRGFAVPDNAALLGRTLHAQAGVLNGATLVLTGPVEFVF